MQSTLASYSDAELAELGFDKSFPQKEQYMPNGKSWQDFFKEETVKYVRELLVLCEAAKDKGIEITAEDRLDEKLEKFKTDCEKRYSVSFDEYLKGTYGKSVDEDRFKRCLELEMLASKYLASVNDSFYDASKEQINAYISQNIESPDNTATRNVYAVLLTGSDAENRADELTSNPDKFDELAKEYEIYYENCKKGDMTKNIDEWLYAEGRSVGDVGTVRSGDALYVLYYSGEGLTVSELEARYALAKIAYDAHLDALYEEFPVDVNEGKIKNNSFS